MKAFLILPFVLAFALPAAAQSHMEQSHMAQGHMAQGHMEHSGHAGHESMTPISEPGQGAFAAIAEVVDSLEADPATDWTKVNISALREHLVDMDLVTTRSAATERALENGVTITIRGEDRVAAAIRRMVIAHSHELAKIDGWQVAAAPQPDGAELTVTSSLPQQVARIKGLGFYGLMATGAHHQTHHWAIATGNDPHS